jgi:peptidoglycan/xylan/chitin deacetylase (PgdA/CDA1 family)
MDAMKTRPLALALLPLAVACSGPPLQPTVDSTPSPADQAPVIPPGGLCAPAQLAAEDATPELAEAPAPVPCEVDVSPSEHTPLRPLGFGYTEGGNPVPARTAYLTFDDGPSEWTYDFLQILADKNVKATFFVTAKQLKGAEGLDGTYVDAAGRTVVYRDVLKRIVDDGHVLANHTVNHPDLARITREQVTSEIEQNELLVNRALVRAGALPRLLPLFRPPYGSPWYTGIAGMVPPRASERISSHGLNIMWNITSTDAADWAVGESYSRTAMPVPTPDPPGYDEKIARLKNYVLGSAQFAAGEGMIVLMHDTHNTTRDALPDIIDGLAAADYAFETVDHYVEWRWQRPAIDMTPGPALYQACVDERNWGCASFDVPVGTDRAREVCGRMWLGFQAFGGESALGKPIAQPSQNAATGIVSQAFERATLELHPENEAPCNVVAIPQ